jgi:hypothetical protein
MWMGAEHLLLALHLRSQCIQPRLGLSVDCGVSKSVWLPQQRSKHLLSILLQDISGKIEKIQDVCSPVNRENMEIC